MLKLDNLQYRSYIIQKINVIIDKVTSYMQKLSKKNNTIIYSLIYLYYITII